jgi:hypothetical protein
MKKTQLIWTVLSILVVAFVSVWAAGIVELFPPPWPNAPLPPQGPAPADALPLTDSLNAESCGKCHQKQYKEWEGSMHSNSFEDPIHQALLKSEGLEFCSGCHLPMTEQTPVFVSFDTGAPVVEPNPDFQPELMSQGVSCAVCHLREWVRHGPPHEGETEEEASKIHQVKFMEAYEQSEFCASCHQETLEHIPGTPLEVIPPGVQVLWDNTYGEWQDWQGSLAEDHEDKGKQCQNCHMPKEQHTWKGGHSPDMVKRAVDVEVATDKEAYLPGDVASAKISVANVGAGHKFPSGGSGGNNRMVTVTASILDEGGNTVDTQQFPPIMRQMKPPPEIFIEVSDNRLLPGEMREFDYSFTIPEEVEGQLYLNTQVAYFLTPPFLFEAFGAPELIEQFPPTVVFDETKPLIFEKDYSNVFFVDLEQGLNMISLPLEPRTSHTARSLAEELDATVVIKMDTERGKFIGFTVNAPGDGFSIEGAQGYIVNVKEGKTVTFTGATWTNQPSVVSAAPVKATSSAWAFVLNGAWERPPGRDGRPVADEYVVTAKNLRTGAVAVDVAKNSAGRAYFAAVWADLSRKSVVEAGDYVEITVTDAEGNQVSEPVRREISSLDIRNAFTIVRLDVNRIPSENVLAQNYPNPCNPDTWIPFKLAQDTDVVIKIHESSGKLIRKIDLGWKSAGYYISKSSAAHWDGKNDAGESVASGIYFYSIEAGEFTATRKLLIAK